MRILFDDKSGKFWLHFNYNKALVDAIKEFPVRTYNPTDHSWLVGFDSSNLGAIIAFCQANGWPSDQLNAATFAAQAFLKANSQGSMKEDVIEDKITPLIQQLGQLAVDAYLAGTIDEATQTSMIEILNHISLKDFIKS